MSERFDLYALIHKALRNYMGAVLMQLGRLDLSDEEEVGRAGAALLALLDWLESHLQIEERFVHTALAERQMVSLVATLHRDHEEHLRSFDVLRQDAGALLASAEEAPLARSARSRQLYLAVSRFVADNFLHMAVEETEMNLILWQTFTDEELFGIYQAIIASERPDQLHLAVTWLLPAVAPEDRVKIIAGARPKMPEAVFQQLMQGVERVLSPRDYEKLARALGLMQAA